MAAPAAASAAPPAGGAVLSQKAGRPGDAGCAGQLHFAHVQQFEILAGDGVFVAPAQEANVVGVFQVFEAARVAPGFLDVALNGPRILHSAMDQVSSSRSRFTRKAMLGAATLAAITIMVTNSISMSRM